MPMEVKGYDCRSCGACCVHGGDPVVEPWDTQVPRRLTRAVRSVADYAAYQAASIRRMARKPDGACIAFRGQVGNACHCAIYERRPSGCTDYPSGGLGCCES